MARSFGGGSFRVYAAVMLSDTADGFPRNFDILRFFVFDHLPEPLARVSAPFAELAWKLAADYESDWDETEVALRKLLEAKDAAVRAAL